MVYYSSKILDYTAIKISTVFAM